MPWVARADVHEAPASAPAAVVCPAKASFLERLAAKEIRRYVYLRSGVLLPLTEELKQGQAAILVGTKDRPPVQQLLAGFKLGIHAKSLAAEQYWLRTVFRDGREPITLVVGGDPLGTLYGAYRLAEHLGVRFYLHGDVLPDRQTPAALPELDETGRPLFDRRGIQPFHDFPEGPDWWNLDGYRAILAQLPKLRMNFFGLHTYPQGGVGPEPAVWIGPPGEIGAGAAVKASYPARHFTTVNGTWGYRATKTSEYLFGAAALFDRDDYGVDYMRGMTPWPAKPADCNELFERMGRLLGGAFSYAGRLGIKTCLGTETPLVIPDAVKQRLKAAGKDPASPAVVQEIYEGMFRRIAQTHPLDYYWFWTPEGWTWAAVPEPQVAATVADFRAAMAAAEKVRAPFTLATCGWVLGPPQDPSRFDRFLPKTMPMSCISRNVGNSPVEPGFADVAGRPKWSIPWLEDDPGLIIPQLWVGRMRRDAADSLAYGCTGLMGIHWRTRVLGPNVSALAHAAWDQAGWNPEFGKPAKPRTAGDQGARYLACGDFYADWARAEFGPEAAEPVAALFTRLDGKLPRPANWIDGPGGIAPDPQPWEQVAREYAFVDELAALRPRVQGAGNLERFDYWLATFRYLRATARVKCTRARSDAALVKVRAERDAAARKQLARQLALPLRCELVAQMTELSRQLMATVSTYGELGTVANWQQHLMWRVLGAPGRELAGMLGEPLPADAVPPAEYNGPPRLVVPVVRGELEAGEPLRLVVLVLEGKRGQSPFVQSTLRAVPANGDCPLFPVLCWRPLGPGPLVRVPLVHVARGVYSVSLPAAQLKGDFEYHIEAAVGGEKVVWPASAPKINQSVVVE
jgi:hypothetical protein